MRPLVRPLVRPLIRELARGRRRRWVYSFDGVDDFGVLGTRAINPDGDNTFEFFSPAFMGPAVLSQSTSDVIANREFHLFTDAVRLGVVYGGIITTLMTVANGFKVATKYGLVIAGNFFQLFEGGLDGAQVTSGALTRGAAREPMVPTRIGVRGSSTTGTANHFQGIQRNIRINGTLWRIDQPQQAIQLPEPSGLGVELITTAVLENPEVRGSQWTYLGDGRWQLVGDGTANALQFLASASWPNQGFMEFEVESIVGQMRCSADTAVVVGDRVFSTIGLKRVFYTTKPNDFNFIRNATNPAPSCIIKNISFKPLGTCNPLTLVNTNPERWSEIDDD
jgi:hypothetical protein